MSFPQILLIEGDVAEQLAVTQQVDQWELECHCECVNSLADARAKMTIQTFDCVVLDTRMVDDTILALLADLNNQGIPLIAVASVGEEDAVIYLMRQGASDYLMRDRERHYLKLLPVALQRAIASVQIKKQLADITEQQQTEKQFLRTVIDAVPNRIFVKDSDGQYLLVNQEMADFYGTTVEDLLRKRDADYRFDAAAINHFAQENRRVIETGQDLFIPEEQDINYQGEERWLQWHKVPIQIPGHSQTAVLGVGTDITQHKQTLQKIAFHASLLDQVRNAVIATDLNGQIIYWNHYAEVMYQWQAAEVIGANIIEVLVPIAAHAESARMLEQLQRQGHWEGELDVYRKDGTILPVQMVDNLTWNQQGELIGYITVSSDISDRRRSEAERNHQEQLLEGQRRVLERLALDTPLPEILTLLVQIIEAQAEGSIGSILLLQGQRLYLGAAPSLPDVYNQAINGFEIGPQAGSCGSAAYWQEPVVVADIATDPLWQNYRAFALPHGLRACWSVPIFSKLGTVLGTFALYHQEPYTPDSHDWKLVNVAVNLAALAIERKRTEQSLHQSEERFRATFEQAAIGICHISPNGQFLRFNQRFCDISGYTAEELQVLTFQEITYPEDRPIDLQRFHHLLTGQLSTYTLEKRYVRKDRNVIWVNLTVSLVRDEAGEPSYLIGIVEDITDRKQVEVNLYQSEQRYATLAEAAPVGIFRTNAMGQCLYVNDRWCQITGLPLEQAKGNGWIEALHPDDRENVFVGWEEAMRVQQPFRLEYRFQRLDGMVSWVFGQAVAEYTPEGEIAGFVGTITDITDRKLAEAALHTLNQELEIRVEQRTAELQEINRQLQQSITERQKLVALVENSTDFIATATPSGRMTYLNQAGRQQIGLAPTAEITDYTLSDFHFPADWATLQQSIKAVAEGESWQGEVRLRHLQTEAAIPVMHSAFPIKHSHTGGTLAIAIILRDITERKQTEQQLHDLSDRLTLAITAAKIGIWEWDIPGNTVIWDDRIYELYGLAQEGVAPVYETWLHAIHPDDRAAAEIITQQALRGERDYDPEFRVIHPDGSIHHIQSYAFVQRDPQGTPLRMVGINYDITDRKQAEAAIRDSERRYATLTEAAPVAIFRADTTGQCIYMNDRWGEMTHRPAAEGLGWGWAETIHPQDRERIATEVTQWIQTCQKGDLYQNEARVVCPDGTTLWFFCQMSPETDASGRVTGCVGTLIDISDRKHAEAALQASEERWQLAVAGANDGIWDWNVKTDTVFLSARWKAIRGFSEAEVSNSLDAWSDGIHPDDYEAVMAGVSNHFAGNTEFFEMEYRVRCKDGSYKWILDRGKARRDETGQVVRMAGSETDITHRKLAEAALRESEAWSRSLMEGAGDAIILSNIEGHCLTGNRKAEELLGYTREEISHLTIPQIHPLQELERHTAEFANIVQTGFGQVIDVTVLCKDGTTVPVDITASVIMAGGQQVVLGSFRDTTERKKAELALRASEARFRSYFELSLIGMAITSLEKGWMEVNDKLCDILGYPREELIQLTWAEITHPDDLDIDLAHFNRVLSGETDGYSMDKRFIRKDGAVIYASISVRCLRQDGIIDYFVALVQDITSQKQAEIALQESEARNCAILEAIPDLLLRLRKDGTCLDCILPKGTQAQQFVPIMRHLSEVLPPDQLRHQLGIMQQAIATRELQVYEHQLIKQHELIVEEVRIAAINSEEVLIIIRDITKQKQAETALRESQAALLAAQQVAHIGNWVLDVPTQTVTASAELYRMFEFAPSQSAAAYEDYLQKIHPEDRAALTQCINTTIAAGTNYVIDYRILLPDGTIRYLEGRGQAVYDQQGQVVKLHGTALDITDRKQVELELRQNRDLREAIFEESADALFIVDPVTQLITDCNQRAVRMLEAEHKHELINTVDTSLQRHSFSSPELDDMIAELNSSGFWSREIEYVTCQGRYFWANMAITTILVADRAVRLVRLTDISERKEIEQLLQQQLYKEQLLVSVLMRIRDSLELTTILDATVQEVRQVLGADRILVYQFNPDHSGTVVAEACEGPWEPILNRSFSAEPFPPDCFPRYLDGGYYLVENRDTAGMVDCACEFMLRFQIQAKLVVPIVQQESKTLWGLLIAHQCSQPREWEFWEIGLLQQLAGQLAIAIHQANLYQQVQAELAERQRAEAILKTTNEQLQIVNRDLERATHLKDEFLASMSHELRTPLNAILGMSETLQERVFGALNDQQQKAIHTIEHSGRHLLDLINDILDLAKIEAGKLELCLVPCAVQTLCTSSLSLVKQIAYQKNIRLSSVIAPDLGDIEIDDRRMRQVLVNLLSNAIKFTPEGGSVTLEVWNQTAPPPLATPEPLPPDPPPNSHFMYFSVLDTGIGIAPEDIPKLFQAFVQIDSSLNRQYNGTGLGLALVKRITELHCGCVQIESQLGQGSRFTVILPYHPLASSARCPRSQSAAEAQPSGLVCHLDDRPLNQQPLLLLAEDNPANIETYSNYLVSCGYRLVVANNGAEAVSLANQHHPDVILMDIQMPDMDGLEAARQIRALPELDSIPIVALTALAMPGDRERCMAAGMNEYLTKPIRLRHLANRIAQLLDF